MKVRWTKNSLRLRITPTEMAEIMRGASLTENLLFPGGAGWEVRLEPAAETRLSSKNETAVLFLSETDRQRLVAPEAEGVYFQTDDGLRYFVEKDFPCVHPSAAEAREIPTERFDAPEAFERRKREAGDGG